MAFKVTLGSRFLQAEAGTSIRELILQSDTLLDFPCGGRGTCGQCGVRVDPVEAAQGDRAGELFLACRSQVRADCSIDVPEHRKGTGEFANAAVTGEAAISADRALVRRLPVKLTPPSLQDQRSDLTRLEERLSRDGLVVPSASVANLEDLSQALRESDWSLDVISEDSQFICTASPGRELYGFAIDLGTTTVDVALYDLESAVRIGRKTLFNKQSAYGADVISRTQAFQNNRKAVRAGALDTIEEAARALLDSHGLSEDQVIRSVIVGNPVMIHILHDLNPLQLTQAPYIPLLSGAARRPPSDFGWSFQGYGVVETLPMISAWVGGDTTAVALSLDMLSTDQTELAVDVGTNGEIVLARGGTLYATSAAAGPAFEGAQISCGSRAVPGAICHVTIGPEQVELDVLGDGPARSICGTALIMAVAGLLEVGVLDETGRLLDSSEAPSDFLRSRLVEKNGQPAFALVGDGSVYVSQKDIREMQLAKGAIRTAIESLLDETGTPWDQVSRVHLAGNFGAGMSVEAEMRIGLLPTTELSRVDAVGNAALRGASLALMSRDHGPIAGRIASECRFLELAGRPDFQMRFADAMMF